MAVASFFKSVQVAFQSAKAAPVTINAITRANPGVISWLAGTDPVNGNYVLLRVGGMTQIGNRVLRLANVNAAANTAELEGTNTTNFGAFTEGSFEVVTFGTTLDSALTISASGGEPEFEDITTIHDDIRKRAPVVNSPFSMQFDLIWDPADLAQVALGQASDELTERAFLISFPNGRKLVGNGFVSATNIPTGQAQGVVRTSLTVEGQGRPRAYAT